jgi:hypothetical protein
MLALLPVCEILRPDNTADGAPSTAKGKRAIRLAGALVLITVISSACSGRSTDFVTSRAPITWR